MALFSSNFSFGAPSSRPENLYTYETSLDNVSPTSSRCGSPSSPTASSTSSSNSSTDDLFGLTSNLSSSSLYAPGRGPPLGRRSPPRSTPFTLPPTSAQQSNGSNGYPAEILARRERRQAYVADQLSSQSRRKLSLLVARMLGDEIHGPGARKHPNDGLHPSNVRVVPAAPGPARSCRRDTLFDMSTRGASSSDEEADSSLTRVATCGSTSNAYADTDIVAESIEMDLPVRSREAANRISKRSIGRSAGRKITSKPKK